MKNILHCKLGTQPATLHLRYKYKLRKGLVIKYRVVGNRKWEKAIVDDINDINYVFLSRL